MAEVKFQCKYQIRDNGDMDIFMVQTEPVTKQIRIKDVGGIKILRGIPADPPLVGNLLFRIPSKYIAQFMGAMSEITNDYVKRLESIDKLLDHEGKKSL